MHGLRFVVKLPMPFVSAKMFLRSESLFGTVTLPVPELDAALAAYHVLHFITHVTVHIMCNECQLCTE